MTSCTLFVWFGRGSVALLLTPRQTFIDPTAEKFAEAKDIKKKIKCQKYRGSSTQWIIYSCKEVLSLSRKEVCKRCLLSPKRAFWNQMTVIHLQLDAPIFRSCFLWAAHSSNENTRTKWQRGPKQFNVLGWKKKREKERKVAVVVVPKWFVNVPPSRWPIYRFEAERLSCEPSGPRGRLEVCSLSFHMRLTRITTTEAAFTCRCTGL